MPLRNRERIEGLERELAHLPQHGMNRHRDDLQAPRRKRTARLPIPAIGFKHQEALAHKETQAFAHVGSRNRVPAGLRHLERLRAGHSNCKLTHHGMLPRLVIGVKFAPQNFHVARLGNRLHLFEAFLFMLLRLRVLVTHHQNEVIVLEVKQPHRKRSLPCSFFQETRLAVANKLQVRSRGKTGQPCKLTPRKRRTTLAFAVILEHVLAVIPVFDNRLHSALNLDNRARLCNIF